MLLEIITQVSRTGRILAEWFLHNISGPASRGHAGSLESIIASCHIVVGCPELLQQILLPLLGLHCPRTFLPQLEDSHLGPGIAKYLGTLQYMELYFRNGYFSHMSQNKTANMELNFLEFLQLEEKLSSFR